MRRKNIAKLARAITLLETSKYQSDTDIAVSLLEEILEGVLEE